jgi:hypothetical protein
MLNVIMLSVIMLNVIMLSVVAYFLVFKISGTLATYNNIFVSQTDAKTQCTKTFGLADCLER